MKVLITDDEQHVIQAIRLLVPWSELGIDRILTASSGAEALAVIEQENPEIVITDIVMEDMSGMDIMNFIASRYPATKVIAVSGYNEFEYVRTMLTKGCMDYLLKPLESAALIATVQRVVDSWKKDHESSQKNLHLQEKVHSLSSFYTGSLLFKMIGAKNWNRAYQKLLQSDSSFTPITACKILYYDTTFFPMRKPGFLSLQQMFEEQLRHILRQGGGLMLANPERPGEVILFLYEATESLATSILKLAQSLFRGQPYPFHIGISKKKNFPEQFSEAFFQARDAFLSTYGDHDCHTMAIAAFPVSVPDSIASPGQLQQLENKIFSALLAGHKADLDAAVSNWLDSLLPTQNIPLLQIRHTIDLFQTLFRQWISRIRKQNTTFTYEPPEPLLSYEELTDRSFRFSRQALHQTIMAILTEVSNALKENHSTGDIMQQIAQYMELNYNKPFVQSEYAQQFFLNKDYMSRKFTTTFGVSMLSYLNQIRIRHATELLADVSLKIQDVAFAVGFNDEKYFAKQFKKLVGVSPGDYRASLK